MAAACARLAREHRGTPMAGRTLLQQAVPVTFGLKAAGWLVGVTEAAARLRAAPLADALAGTGGAAWAVRETLEGLTIHPDRMRRNMAVPQEGGMGAVDEFIDRAVERGQTP